MKSKTKKYRGGEINNKLLLDDKFIKNNLKDILNNSSEKYKFDIKIEKLNEEKYYNIFIENEDNITREYNPDNDSCLTIAFNKTQEGISIKIDMIYKCAPINNYGNFILESIKKFANKYGYYSIIIDTDSSYLDLYFNIDGEKRNIIIKLYYLSILSTGKSWYNKMGFYTPINKEQIQDNIYKIKQNIRYINDSVKIMELIEKTLKMYIGIENKIPICYRLVNDYNKFSELYNFILDITKKTDNNSIQEVFQELSNYIKTNCNTITKTCSVDYETILKINCFIQFVYLLLDLKYETTNLIYYVSKTSGGKKIKNTKGRKIKQKWKTKKRY